MEHANRLYFLDNLRSFVILLVVVLHGCVTYMVYAPSWWYVVDSKKSLFFTGLVLLLDVPIMPTLFFIAGYFALPSLVKRGSSKTFLKEKFKRIGLPWIFGVLLLAPPTTYMIYFSRKVPVTFIQFWSSDFWGPMYQQSVYWFLGILFLMFSILSLVYALSSHVRMLKQEATIPSLKLFVTFVALTSAGFLFMNLFFPPDAWRRAGYIFVFQPLRVPLYIGYFILGMYTYQNTWFTSDGYKPRLFPWFPLFILSGLCYLGCKLTILTADQTTILMKAVNSVLFNTFCLSSLMVAVAFFQQYLYKSGFFWESLGKNSYSIYYLHPLFLYPLAFIFLQVSLLIFLKAIVIIILAILLSWGLSALGFRTLLSW